MSLRSLILLTAFMILFAGIPPIAYAEARVWQVIIYLFPDSAAVTIYATANSSRINLTALQPSPSCNFRRVTTSVPSTLLPNGVLLLYGNHSGMLVVHYDCRYVDLGSGVRAFILLPKNRSYYVKTFDVYVYNQTPFFAENLTELNYFGAYTTELRGSELPLVIKVAGSSGHQYYIIIIGIAVAVAGILWLVAIVRRRLKLRSFLLDVYERLSSDVEKRIVRLLVRHNGRMYQYQIVRELGLNKSTVSKALKRLEQRKIVHREHRRDGVLVSLNLDRDR